MNTKGKLQPLDSPATAVRKENNTLSCAVVSSGGCRCSDAWREGALQRAVCARGRQPFAMGRAKNGALRHGALQKRGFATGQSRNGASPRVHWQPSSARTGWGWRGSSEQRGAGASGAGCGGAPQASLPPPAPAAPPRAPAPPPPADVATVVTVATVATVIVVTVVTPLQPRGETITAPKAWQRGNMLGF
eukprot:1785205-Rhodomonas_salina.1